MMCQPCVSYTLRTEGGDKVQAVLTQGSWQVCMSWSRNPRICSILRFGKMLQQFMEFFRGRPRGGATTSLHFPSAPDPLVEASKAPFLTLRVATPSGAPCQAPLEQFSRDFPGVFLENPRTDPRNSHTLPECPEKIISN